MLPLCDHLDIERTMKWIIVFNLWIEVGPPKEYACAPLHMQV